jgi:predicted PurR-regulated permease PerM
MLNQKSFTRINNLLFFIVLTAVILYFGKYLLIVLVFSIFLAMLMTPVARKLEKWGVSETISALLSVFIIVIVFAAILFIVSAQIAAFREDLPEIQTKIEEAFSAIQARVEKHFGISYEQQAAAIKEQVRNFASSAGSFFTGFLTGLGSLIGGIIIMLVFTFLFLLQRNKYEKFILKLVHEEKKTEATKVIGNIANVAQQYLKGRIISITIQGIFYTLGFLILGLQNAILLAAIAALLSFIPYLGPLIGGMLPLFMAIVTEDSLGKALGVLIILLIAQAIDNYFIEPIVVGGSVNISPFFSIFILILGGAIWGIAGVILFLPMLAIVKIIFENVEGMQPYAFLIGDQKKSSPTDKLWSRVKKMFRRENSRA